MGERCASDDWPGCDGVVVGVASMACVHEHVLSGPVCSACLEALQGGGWGCGECGSLMHLRFRPADR